MPVPSQFALVARASEAVKILNFDFCALAFSVAYGRKILLSSIISQLLPPVSGHGQDGHATING
jgi:hypothetical protein